MIYHVIHIWYCNNENSIQHNYRAIYAYVEFSKADLSGLDNTKSEEKKIYRNCVYFFGHVSYIITLIWNRHGLECSRIWKLSGNFIKKCRDFLGRDILGTNLVSFNRAVVSLFELSFLTREGTRLQDHLCALC